MKRIKKRLTVKEWLQETKQNVIPNASKKQPYNSIFMPWALKHYKKFLMDFKHPSFKNQGGPKYFLLDRAKKAQQAWQYDQEWLVKTKIKEKLNEVL